MAGDVMVRRAHKTNIAAWLALGLALLGGFVVYLLVQQPSTATVERAIYRTIALTALSSGLCLIIATSDWWLKR
jgi:uncharacterized membrane protein YdjX (TVP38/TMEM64 family)